MSKLLDLKITTEELKSSQPPKPSPNSWEQFLPDSKVREGLPLARLDSVADSVDCEKIDSEPSNEKPIEPRVEQRGDPVPREVSL